MQDNFYDVVVVGAGISGIGVACNLKRRCPGMSFTILERRQRAGGTWDLFRYPGVRSDSDMLTLGYSFKPWNGDKVLADGPSIQSYVEETVQENGIVDDIQFGLKIISSSFSSQTGRWSVRAVEEATGASINFECRFLVMGTGYYKYDAGYKPDFPGSDRFTGQVVHPQHWPEDLDCSGKRVVVIGSGATAVTLVPALAGTAAHVTMLQRTPTYVISMPQLDGVLHVLSKLLPERWALKAAREKNVIQQILLFKLFRRFPNLSRKLILKLVKMQLDGKVDMKHFSPSYKPWDQRLCIVPDGDLFGALREGQASVVTDHIETFTETGIKLKSGETLEADIIITATGLDLQALGGMEMEVDGKAINLAEKMFYKATMIEDVPNFSWIFGYTNASWTLKANIAATYICRVLNYMNGRGVDVAVPVDREGCKLVDEPFMGSLTSGYIKRANDRLPRQGSKEPWRILNDFKRDQAVLQEETIDDGVLQFRQAGEVDKISSIRRAA